MAGAPLYTSQLQLPSAEGPTIQPIPLPPSGGTEQIGQAVQQFGQAAAQFRDRLQEAQEHTKVAVATTSYLTRLSELEQQYVQDRDYENAPKNFARDRAELEQQSLGGIDNSLFRERARTEFRRAGIASEKRVSEKAVSNEIDVNVAALDQQELANLHAAATAASPAERLAAVDRNNKAIDGARTSSWISDQAAGTRNKRFAALLENNDAMEIIRADPKRFLELVHDPQNFPTLDPVTRQSYIGNATIAADDRAIAGVVNRSRFKPEIASLELGRVISPAHADAIFANGIVPQEGGKRDGVALVSPKGAIGVSQILPGTARDMAKQLGLNDVAALDDKALEQRLKDDEPLNYQLGRTYFRQMLTRYEGNVPLAMAAYNAGPGRADEWKAKAEEKFGTAFTPAQLASVIGIKETRDYLGGIYERMGAKPDGAGVSPAAAFRAATQVGGEVQSQINAADHVARTLASTARTTDNIIDTYRAGYNVDPQRETVYRQTQQAAAARGDAQAAQAIRDLDEAKAMAPFHRAAWSLPPVQLEATVASLEAAAATSPNVTGEQQRQLKAFRAVRDEIRTKRDEPIALGEAAGYFKPVAIDPAAPANDPNFARALAARGQQAVAAQQIYQGAANPFRREEAAAIKERWANAGEPERFALLETMARTMPERAYRAGLAQIAGDDGTTITAGLMAPTRPELARQVLHGAALLKTPEIEKKADPIRQALRSKMPGELYPSPDMQADVIHAALAVYTAQRGREGALYDPADEAGLERALEQVTGPIVRRNGQRVPAPARMTRSQFADRLDGATDADFNLFGGAYDRNLRPFDASFIASKALLVPRAPGSSQYAVFLPSASSPDGRAPVLTIDGNPLVIDVARFTPRDSRTPAQRERGAFREQQARELEDARQQSEQAP